MFVSTNPWHFCPPPAVCGPWQWPRVGGCRSGHSSPRGQSPVASCGANLPPRSSGAEEHAGRSGITGSTQPSAPAWTDSSMFVCEKVWTEEGGDEWAGNIPLRLPCVCWGDDKDGGQGELSCLFLGLFGGLRLPYLLLKTVQFPLQPRYGTIFRHVVLCAVAVLTCKVLGTQQARRFKVEK